ncbi:MAG: lycopene cyclase domain-containing protein [Candidatus Nanohaloarchaea archaeon]
MEYLLILLLLLASAIGLEWRYGVRVYRSVQERIAVTGIFLLTGILWDSYAIIRGHWSFDADALIGVKIGVMPLEEYLFALIVPFWILTVYTVVDERLYTGR